MAWGARTRLASTDVDSGLAWVAASGRLGYDLAHRAWFHRELPVDSEKILSRNPRLTAAGALVADGGIRTAGLSRWHVRGNHGELYEVIPTPGRLRCTCVWEAEHHGARGPCKHILAAVISLREEPNGHP